MSDARGMSPSTVVLAFLMGGAVGAFLGLLYAPESGRQTRGRLRRLAEEAQDKAEDAVKDFRGKAEDRLRQWRDQVDDAVTKGKEFLEDKKNLLTSAYEAGRETFVRERQKLSGGESDPAPPR